MSQKQEKKTRQLYRRDMRGKIEELTDEYRTQISDLLKPAPRFMPSFVWVSIQKMFLNV